MKKIIKSYLVKSCLFGGVWLGVVACKKDNGGSGTVPNQDKVTTVNLELAAPKGKLDAIATFSDPNGINNQTATNTVTVDANATYIGTITLEDESKNPKANVTMDYVVSYQISGIDATISGGVSPTLTTRATGNGTLRINLTKANKISSVTFPLSVRQ
ncbi:hypothetical protein [Adhaeribacter aquaticus]|uniref:hypothetical protein n=1 Tax=Adhaeribacter aquaticus TaxID=299567 RepID=UPI0004104C2E|nr:hypothetical protein [Adhaeribacter aquaticus]